MASCSAAWPKWALREAPTDRLVVVSYIHIYRYIAVYTSVYILYKNPVIYSTYVYRVAPPSTYCSRRNLNRVMVLRLVPAADLQTMQAPFQRGVSCEISGVCSSKLRANRLHYGLLLLLQHAVIMVP